MRNPDPDLFYDMYSLAGLDFLSTWPSNQSRHQQVEPDFEYKNYRWGIHAGGAARFNLSTVFYLQPELLFSVKGSRVHEDFFISPYLGFEYVFEYLTIPCLAGIRLGERASLHIGPEINILLGGTFQITDHPSRLKNFPTTTDIGVTGGLVFHPLHRLEIGLRYEYGFADIPNITLVDNQGLYVGLIPGGNNRNLQLSVGYILGARHIWGDDGY